MKKRMTCIVCPVGCQMEVDENYVSGNRCQRGKTYAILEMTNPKRTLTTTVRTTSLRHPRLSVKSNLPLPKDKIIAAIRVLNDIILDKETRIGDVVVENILETGVDMVATNHLTF